jgi:hypothetical protein
VEAAVFDKDFVGMHAGHNHTREVHAAARALKSGRINDWL